MASSDALNAIDETYPTFLSLCAELAVRADITHQDLRVLHLMLSALLERSAGQPELCTRYAELFLEAVSVRPPPRPLSPAPGEEDVARLLAWNPAKENPA